MSQIRGQLIVPGETTRWHPISLEDLGGGEYALKIAGTIGVVATLGVGKHYNGSAGVSNTNIPFAVISKSIFITNTHATQTLQVSFDGGTLYYDIESGESVGLDAAHTSIDVKASGAGTTYQILTTE